MAMKEHPDKGGDKVRFQVIGEAYQVLSDNAKRKKYDEQGRKALDSDGKMADAAVVFAMMFGEEKFGHLVGELALVTMHKLKEEGMGDSAMATKLREVQRRREEVLAKGLATRLDEWLTGDKESFVKVPPRRMHRTASPLAAWPSQPP